VLFFFWRISPVVRDVHSVTLFGICKGQHLTALANGVTADPQAVNFFNNQNNTPAVGKPKAYLNVLF
jgi:carbamoylphosphate synthase small subunit